MKHVDSIRLSYRLTNDALRRNIDALIAGGDTLGLSDAELTKSINDQAYLFLFFAQFEALVVSLSDRLLQEKLGQAAWADRRAWEALNADRLYFLQRLALLTDKGRTEYATVKAIYLDRNKIAHGFLLTSPADPIEVAAELERIAALLTREHP